ncbi:MAG: isochorismatase family protein [Actinobacteria bacterium]|nr:isochorismatase family protein [Actinomycetota bacterium]MCI0678380.1 isochorismatase family protein [Actinomycetota bacterium]
MRTAEAVETLIDGLPQPDADRYRDMFARQPPWGFGSRPALLVVDLQRGFVEDGYPLGNPTAAKPCIEANLKLLEVARRTDVPVFFTRAMVWPNAVENGAWLRGAAMEDYGIGEREGELDLAEVLDRRPNEVVIDKPKPSAFYGTQLEAMLTYLSVDTLIVTGAATGRCVRATVDDAFARNYRVILPIEAVMGGPGISHRIELLDMGILIEVVADLMSVDDCLAAMGNTPTGAV